MAVPMELLAVIAYIFSALHEVTPLTRKAAVLYSGQLCSDLRQTAV